VSIIEIKAFVPAREFDVSLAFYQALGFEVRSSGGGIAYLAQDGCSFLLQDYYDQTWAENCQLHILVDDVDAWFARVHEQDLAGRFGSRVTPIQEQPYRMRDFTVSDPCGVCWVIGENILPVVAHG